MIEHDYLLLIPKKTKKEENLKSAYEPIHYISSMKETQKLYLNDLSRLYEFRNVRPLELRKSFLSGPRKVQVVVEKVSQGGRNVLKELLKQGILPTEVITNDGVLVKGGISRERVFITWGIVASDLRVLFWSLENKILEIINAKFVIFITCYALSFVTHAIKEGSLSGIIAVPNTDMITSVQASNEVVKIIRGRRWSQ